MRFHVSKEAEEDLDEIFVYWARRGGLEVADRIVEAIGERFALLGDFPNGGRRCDEIAPGVRSFPTGKYLIYYRKSRRAVEILHVFHGARDRERAFKKAKRQ
jgi:toxin ParE1/3/4